MKQSDFSFFAAANLLAVPALCKITGYHPVQIIPTGTPNPAGPGGQLSSYPKCSLDCAGTNIATCRDPTQMQDAACQCSAPSRGNASACEALVCDDADYLKAASLALDACGSFYLASPSLSSAANAAISTGTSSALAALATSDPTNPLAYPACAQKCQPPALAAGGCIGGLSDRQCTCHCPVVDYEAGSCEVTSCSRDDINLITFLVDALCGPVGGAQPKLTSACRNNNTAPYPTGVNATLVEPMASATGASQLPSATIPFTGDGAIVKPIGLGFMMVFVVMTRVMTM